MTILVDWEIRKELGDTGCIRPWEEAHLNPNSYNIRLGWKLGRLSLAHGYYAIDPQDKASCNTEYFTFEEYRLAHGEFLLAEMLEEIWLPNNINSQIKGRSSLGRYGLINSSHAGLIDCGFASKITLELYNSGPLPIILRPEMGIGQLEFKRTETPSVPYNKKKDSKYYMQSEIQGSLGI